MPGQIFNIQKFSIHDGPGIRTTVFFAGCPFRCYWCHNPEAFADRTNIKMYSAGGLFKEVSQDTIFYDESGGGVTFSGGEPLLQTEFLKEILGLCKKAGIHTAVDTTGFTEPANLMKILSFTDLFLYDLKLMNSSQHQKYCGQDNTVVLENLKLLAEEKADTIIRIPLIPQITDTDYNLRDMIEFILSTGLKKIEGLPYHDTAGHKYLKYDIPNLMEDSIPLSEKRIIEIISLFRDEGLEIKIGV